MNISKMPEVRIFFVLASISLALYLLSFLRSVLALFADVFIVVILSWILAFVLEPMVAKLSQKRMPRVAAAGIIYLLIALLSIILISVVLPAIITQFTHLSLTLPVLLPQNQVWSGKVEDFLTSTLSNSAVLASSVATAATGVLLVLVLSFYFLVSRGEISKFILNLIPDEYEEDYLFLENVVTNTFASFLRVQVFLGLVSGVIVLATLVILGVDFALSTSIFSAFLAMIPVVGPLLMLLPIILAAMAISIQKMIIATLVVLLAGQLVYNIWSPKLLGDTLKIHPIIVFLSFLVGFKIASFWGAVFAVPVAASIAIVGQELIRYWKEEVDRK